MEVINKKEQVLRNGHGEVLTSPPFVSFLIEIYKGTYEKILGYERFRNFKVPKIRMKVMYDPSDQTTAYTDGNAIVINAGNASLVPSHLELGVKKDVVTGLMLHEQGHVLYTDFSALKDIFVNFTDRMLEAGFSQEFVDSFANSRQMENAFQQLYAQWNNVLEDGVIEPQIYHKVYGRSKYGLTALRSIHYGSMQTFEEINETLEAESDANTTIMALFSLFLTYGKFNSFKVVEHESLEKKSPARDIIERGYESVMEVLTETNPTKRPFLSLKALVPFEEELQEIFDPEDFMTNEEYEELMEALQSMLEQSGSDAFDDFDDFLDDLDSKSKVQSQPMEADESASGRSKDKSFSPDPDKDEEGSQGGSSGDDSDEDESDNQSSGGGENGEDQNDEEGNSESKGGSNDDNSDGDESEEDGQEQAGNGKDGEDSDEKSNEESEEESDDNSDEDSDDKSEESSEGDSDDKSEEESDEGDKSKPRQNETPEQYEDGGETGKESTLQDEIEALGEDTKRDSIVGDDNFDGFGLDGMEEASSDSLESVYEEISRNVDTNALETLVDRYLDLQKEKEMEMQAEELRIKEYESAFDTSFLDPNVHAGVRHDLYIIDSDSEIPNHLINQFKPYSNEMANSVEKVLKRRVKAPYGSSYSGRKLNTSRLYSRNMDIFKPIKPDIKKERLAVFVLVDQSGSMFGERMTSARLASLVLYDFCNTLDIPVMIAGHSTAAGSTVDLDVYTDFDNKKKEDYSAIASMSPGGANRDGYALSWAYSMLDKRREEKKLLIIINDGQPNDYGYSGSVARNDIRNLKKIHEARGIQTVAAAIGDDFEMIREIYDDSFVGISDLSQLPVELGDILKKTVLR